VKKFQRALLRGFLFLGVGVLSGFGSSSRDDGPCSVGFTKISILFSK
jgi:hypothetical protein